MGKVVISIPNISLQLTERKQERLNTPTSQQNIEITREHFAPEASNLVGRLSLMSRLSSRCKVKPILDMLGRGALVFQKHLFFKSRSKIMVKVRCLKSLRFLQM